MLGVVADMLRSGLDSGLGVGVGPDAVGSGMGSGMSSDMSPAVMLCVISDVVRSDVGSLSELGCRLLGHGLRRRAGRGFSCSGLGRWHWCGLDSGFGAGCVLRCGGLVHGFRHVF